MAAAPTATKRGAQKLGDLVSRVLDPLTARRGHATANLMAGWADIVGPRYADWSRPQHIRWPRGSGTENAPAVLIVRAEGPRAIFLQHEAGQIIERVNAFFGYAAIGELRIVQAPVANAPSNKAPASNRPEPEVEGRLDAITAAVDDDQLRSALKRLGRGVLTDTGE